MKKILITPAGHGQVDLIKYFKNKKYKVFTLDDDAKAIGHNYSDLRIGIKTNKLKDIKKYVKKNKLNVVTTASDFGFKLKNKILFNFDKANKLNNLLNKYFQKKIWKKIKPSAKFYKLKDVNKNILRNNKFVVKPIFGAGSENVYLVDIKNYNIIKKKIKLNSTYFVEKFYPGDEYIVDGFKHKDKTYILLIAKKKKIFFSVANVIYNHDLNSKVLELLKDKVRKFINLMDYPDGPFHSEFIIKNNEIDMIEFHPRAIGYNIYNKLISKIYGIDMYNLDLKGLNKKIEKKLNKKKFPYFCARFFDIKKNGRLKHIRIQKKKIKDVELLSQVYFKKNDFVKFSISDSSRFGYVFALAKKKINLLKITKDFESKNFKVDYY